MYTPIFAKNNPFFFSPMIIAIVKDGFVILQKLILLKLYTALPKINEEFKNGQILF